MQFEFAKMQNIQIGIQNSELATFQALLQRVGIARVYCTFIITTVPLPRCCDGCICIPVCVYMTTMQSITQSAVQERLVMEEELKKALDRCEELEQSSVPMG